MKTVSPVLMALLVLVYAAIAGQVDSSGIEADTLSPHVTKTGVDSSNVSAPVAMDSAQKTISAGTAPTATVDSAQSAAEFMYRRAAQNLRRDMPLTPASGADTNAVSQKKRVVDTAAVLAPPTEKKTDSYLVIPGSQRHGQPGHPAQLKKNTVLLIACACALVAAGVVLYAVTNSKGKGAAEVNNRIPPPPDPPSSHEYVRR